MCICVCEVCRYNVLAHFFQRSPVTLTSASHCNTCASHQYIATIVKCLYTTNSTHSLPTLSADTDKVSYVKYNSCTEEIASKLVGLPSQSIEVFHVCLFS